MLYFVFNIKSWRCRVSPSDKSNQDEILKILSINEQNQFPAGLNRNELYCEIILEYVNLNCPLVFKCKLNDVDKTAQTYWRQQDAMSYL